MAWDGSDTSKAWPHYTELEKEEEWKVCCLCEAISSLRQSSLPVKHPNTHQNKPHLVLPAPSTDGAGPGATSRQKTRLEFPGEQLGFGRIGCPAPASWPAKPKQVLDLGGEGGSLYFCVICLSGGKTVTLERVLLFSSCLGSN